MSKANLTVWLVALLVLALVAGNIFAMKLWDLNLTGLGIPFEVSVDGGLLVFPLSYVVGDLTVEFLGERRARTTIWASFAAEVIFVLLTAAVVALPPYPGWDNQDAFATFLGFEPRIIAGSLCGYVASQLVNNRVFTVMRQRFGEEHFWTRAICSSAVAKIFDIGLFETIAFFGVLSLSEFVAQAIFAYLIGFAVELILSPVTVLIRRVLRARLTEHEFRKEAEEWLDQTRLG